MGPTRSKDFGSPSVRNASSKELGSRSSNEKVESKDSISPFPINNVTDIDLDSFPSPVDRAVNNFGEILKNAFSSVEPIFCLEDWLEHRDDDKKQGGSYSDQTESFSRKRQKLLQWAHKSFPEIEEPHSKGLESDRSRETMLSNIYSPLYNNRGTLQNSLESPRYELREKNLISCIEGDSTFGFPSVRHGSFLPFSSFKEPDDLYDPTGSFPGREPQFPLLEWDSINMNKRSLDDSQSSWDHQQSLNVPFSSIKNLDDSHDPVASSPGRELHLPLLEWHSVDVNERSLSAACSNSNWTLIPAVQSSWNHQQSQNNWCESFGWYSWVVFITCNKKLSPRFLCISVSRQYQLRQT